MAEEGATSCLGFNETVYQCRVTLKMTVYRAAIGAHSQAQSAAHTGTCASFATTP
jgi:hypothetical protein